MRGGLILFRAQSFSIDSTAAQATSDASSKSRAGRMQGALFPHPAHRIRHRRRTPNDIMYHSRVPERQQAQEVFHLRQPSREMTSPRGSPIRMRREERLEAAQLGQLYK